MSNLQITETYDLFEIYNKDNGLFPSSIENRIETYDPTNNESKIKDTNQTNPFRGFWNDNNFAAGNPNFTQVISGKHFAPDSYAAVDIQEDGTIVCYPPPVDVAGWRAVSFKLLKYAIDPDPIDPRDTLLDPHPEKTRLLQRVSKIYWKTYSQYFPTYQDADGDDTFKPITTDKLEVLSKISNPDKTPIFLKWDEYPSRSKVVLSKDSEPTRHVFSYPRGSNEPVRVYLSFSAQRNYWDEAAEINKSTKLDRDQIDGLLLACSFQITWEQIPESNLKKEA